jgi:hypothetical protein
MGCVQHMEKCFYLVNEKKNLALRDNVFESTLVRVFH